MNNKLISVIIPIYNRESYLEKCIQSVLNQKNVSTQIILIDDGSTDNSPEICDKFCTEYENIITIHNTNHGLAYSRNCGLDNATGDYIFFLDSDDTIAPYSLFNLQQAIEETDSDYCIGNFEQYTDSNELYYHNVIPQKFANKTFGQNDIWDLLAEANSFLLVIAPGKLYKKELWETLRFPIVPLSEDLFILPDVVSNSKRIHVLDKVIYLQTLSAVSMTRSTPDIRILQTCGSMLSLTRHLCKIKKFNVALFAFGDGTRRLIKYKKILTAEEAQILIRKYYKGYKEASKLLSPNVDSKNKVRLFIFRISLNLYGFIRGLTRPSLKYQA